MTTQEQQQALADLYAKVAAAHENAERLTQEIKRLSKQARDAAAYGDFGISLAVLWSAEAAYSAVGAVGNSLSAATSLIWNLDKLNGDNQLTWLDPVQLRVERQDAAPVVAEPCDNPACHLPACEDERDRLDQLGAALTVETSQRDLAEAWEGPR